MYKVTKEDLRKFEIKLFHDGLCGGGSIVPVELENGVNVKKDFHYLYSDKDITVRFFYKRNDNGVWCDLIRIQFENTRLHTIMTFYCE